MGGWRISDVKHEAVKQFLRKVTVPILCDTPKGIDHIGTGTLFEIDNKYFLITAQHIFENFNAKDLSIPNNPTDSDLQTLGRFVLHKPSCEAIDIAVLQLQESRTIDTVKKGWRLLKPENAAPASPEGAFLLCGYPSQRITVHGGRLAGTLLIAYTARLGEMPKEAKQPVDPHLDLFFRHDTNPTDLDGQPIAGPHLGGTSGCSIWEYYESASRLVWTPESALRIIGIQSSFLKGQFIRTKSWEFVMATLREIDPNLSGSGAVEKC